jgi:deazaflavin-dependent oxidoreductase (nitroreductase family)
MSTNQRVEQNWATPTREQIVHITRGHVAALERSDDDAVWTVAGMHHVVLTTVGRRSGTEHAVALPTWNEPAGCRVVVASFAGADSHPAWYLNLRDRAANPRVRCRVQGGEYWSVPEILDAGLERERLWPLLVADRAWYGDYQAQTSRTIPLVLLPESERIR